MTVADKERLTVRSLHKNFAAYIAELKRGILRVDYNIALIR